MAEHTPTGPLELGARMDYGEHERTYKLFVQLAKWGAIVCVGLLAAMALAFFGGGGFFSALVMFFVILAGGGYLLRDIPTHVT
jgi:Bacterial aa3 type cytochrome c oxidase subunit IV